MLETYSNNFLILVSQLDIELAIPILPVLSKTSSFIDPDLTLRLQGQSSEEDSLPFHETVFWILAACARHQQTPGPSLVLVSFLLFCQSSHSSSHFQLFLFSSESQIFFPSP